MSSKTHYVPSPVQKLVAEVLGTFVLVFGILGTAGIAAGVDGNNTGAIGVAFAHGFALLAAIYAFGHISGGHFNPAVTIGLWVAGRFPARGVLGYIIAQVVGAILAAGAVLATKNISSDGVWVGLAGQSNFYDGALGYNLGAALIIEVVTTAVFVLVIIGATSAGRRAGGFAPIAIALTIITIAFIAIPVTNASFNPARSIAAALFGGTVPLQQLWVFIVAPIVGAILAALIYRGVFDRKGVRVSA